jgi:hypothetical protein
VNIRYILGDKNKPHKFGINIGVWKGRKDINEDIYMISSYSLN